MPFTLPVGTIMPFAGDTTNPAIIGDLELKGWMPCQGATVPASTFPELFAVIGTRYGGNASEFKLPDMRGYFVQGVDAAGQNTGPAGSLQSYLTRLPRNTQIPFTSDSQGTHSHTTPNLPQSYGDCLIVAGWHMAEWNGNQLELTGEAGDHTHTVTGGDAETRPLNVYADYIIRFRDI